MLARGGNTTPIELNIGDTIISVYNWANDDPLDEGRHDLKNISINQRNFSEYFNENCGVMFLAIK